jgi:hypothetical protein
MHGFYVQGLFSVPATRVARLLAPELAHFGLLELPALEGLVSVPGGIRVDVFDDGRGGVSVRYGNRDAAAVEAAAFDPVGAPKLARH